MKKKAVIVGIVLAGIMMAGLFLSACNSLSEDDALEASVFDHKITVYQSKVEIMSQLQAAAAEYSSQSGVKIEVQVLPAPGDSYLNQLSEKFEKGDAPTIFATAGGSELAQFEQYCADLGDSYIASHVSDESILETGSGQTILGLPMTIEGFGMLYNKSLVDATALRNTKAVQQMMVEQKASGITGFGLSQLDYFLIGHMMNLPFAVQENPKQFISDLNEGKVSMAKDPIFQEFAQLYGAIRENNDNPLEVTYAQQCTRLQEGRAAVIHQGNWCYPEFSNPNMVSMGLAPLPLHGNDKLSVAPPAYWSVNNTQSGEEIQAAKEFLDWLYQSDAGKKYIYNQMGFIPVIKGDRNENLSPLSKDVQRYITENKTLAWPMIDWPFNVVGAYLAPVAHEFFENPAMTEDGFLEALDKAWGEAVKAR
jgi:raffinose/stachyose/melibiose transport system substrate-binding protein